MQAGKESERAILAVMMMGDAVLITVLRCCCCFFGWNLRDFGSAFGGRVLRMSEVGISSKCDAVVRCCGVAVLSRLPVPGAWFDVMPAVQRKRVGFLWWSSSRTPRSHAIKKCQNSQSDAS
jgi:hypothetical protein